MNDAPAPGGYRFEAMTEAGVLHVHASDAEGAPAARGRGVVIDGAVIFDRIAVEPEHQRRGLGGAVMRELQQRLAGPGWVHGLLVATDAGRSLYETLGWRTLSEYVTGEMPG